ncbi:uncharacterized protein AMSG_01524 [Thecamonas trahens ATCC 50062]|uniref:GPI-anchored wall transfer protein 1 n=1 Tax=Thecamonas trahens ATCC 50062 TaxID=461836 RepID=A0A0L0DTA2_THETB|nr:hypothetical protein AMSG_01524 [Thecamonas trahens ATCC 50062]KNC54673.1 hypothetical protein AMSG_01524 [Thecamonas trahens ATCC 50062]|eukprot:XP_013761575.1 hypothetical protein AMSG_01524 [Thecamonas trahens ATCC 50062]
MDDAWREAREAHVAGLSGSPLWVVCAVSLVLPVAAAASMAMSRWPVAAYAVRVFLLPPGLLQAGVAALSTYRAMVMVATAVAILAVDFDAFPRMYAKTEVHGVSLMDVGVGSFVFSKGMVTPPERKATLGAFVANLAPLLVMANIRLVVHKAIGYQEHVSEYGVHLSFYHTLCGILVVAWTLPRMSRAAAAALGLAAAAAYQLALTGYDSGALQAYLLDPDPVSRTTSFAAANREGLYSLGGYAGLLLLGMGVGAGRNLASPRRLLAIAAAAWAVYAGLVLGFGLQASRRLANGPYIAWIVAHNVSLLAALVALHAYGGRGAWKQAISPAVAFVNGHQLLFFILANLGTGIVNLSIDTLSFGPTFALIVVSCYILAVPLVVSAASSAIGLVFSTPTSTPTSPIYTSPATDCRGPGSGQKKRNT